MIIPGILGILLAIIYTKIVYLMNKSGVWNWWHRFISTLVSILVGISITLLIFNYQQTALNTKKREVLVKVINSELSDMREYLSKDEEFNIRVLDKVYSFNIISLHPQSLADAAKSGLFNEEISINLFRLSRKMEMYDLGVQQVLNHYTQPVHLDHYEFWQKNMNTLKSFILSDMELLKISLDEVKRRN